VTLGNPLWELAALAWSGRHRLHLTNAIPNHGSCYCCLSVCLPVPTAALSRLPLSLSLNSVRSLCWSPSGVPRACATRPSGVQEASHAIRPKHKQQQPQQTSSHSYPTVWPRYLGRSQHTDTSSAWPRPEHELIERPCEHWNTPAKSSSIARRLGKQRPPSATSAHQYTLFERCECRHSRSGREGRHGLCQGRRPRLRCR
jgi:hypothetical protein